MILRSLSTCAPNTAHTLDVPAVTVWHQVFISTPPSVNTASVALIGSEGVVSNYLPAANLYEPSYYIDSVVVDVTTPQMPKYGEY